jgi:hypothetical protein
LPYFLLRVRAVQALQAPSAFQVRVERRPRVMVLILQMVSQLSALIDRL